MMADDGPVKGYVFLSDPEGSFTVLVEPDGTVWVPDDTTRHFVPGRPRVNVLLNLDKPLDACVGGKPARRSWEDGYLPVLRLDYDDPVREVLLYVKGEHLWVRKRVEGGVGQVCVFPGNRRADRCAFDEGLAAIRRSWDAWLRPAWMPPEGSPVAGNVIRSCLVQARCAYTGDQPHYGVGFYGRAEHDGFPPTTLAMADCLFDYSLHAETRALFGAYLDRFVLPDGRLAYYGPSIAEYGQLLTVASRLAAPPGGSAWFAAYRSRVMGLFGYLQSRMRESHATLAAGDIRRGLILGAPEADEAKHPEKHGYYFHNNASVWRGWKDLASMLAAHRDAAEAERISACAGELGRALRRAMDAGTVDVPGIGPVLVPQVGQTEFWPSFTATREASYANYRYYPELLETGFLAPEEAMRIIAARERMGGERDGMTLFFTKSGQGEGPHLDDWTLASYGRGLWRLGQRNRFRRTWLNHTHRYMTPDTHTAYEQVTLEPASRGPYADFCVPVQLVTPRMARWFFQSEDIDTLNP